ncbi:MAG: hypothetical protein K6U89_06030 [Chloroflexi bacterium]|nr:hypothetical protein [Chloroflexota bacterium]
MVDTEAKLPVAQLEPAPRSPRSPRIPALDWGILLVALLSLVALAPLFYPGFFYSHRGLFAAYEVVGLASAPSLTWLPTLAADPTLAQGPLPYWLARLLLLGGIAPTGTIKIVFGASILAATLGTYVLARRLTAQATVPPGPVSWPGLVAATTLAGMPFLAGMVYARGNLAEACALGLVSWALWASLAATGGRAEEPEPALLPVLASAALWTAIGLAHLGLQLASLVLLLALRPRREGWAGPLGGLVLAGAAWAAIAARQPLLLSRSSSAALDLQQVFSPVVSDALLPQEGLTLSLGPLAALAALLTLAPLGVRRPLGLVGAAALLIGLALAVALPLWERLPAVFSQPYQLLGVAGLALALALARLVQEADLARPAAATAIAALALIAGYPAFTFQPVQVREPTRFAPAFVDQEIVLLETELRVAAARPGGIITIVLVWQGRAPIGRDLTVFTHLQDRAHRVVAQHDGPPVDGRRPTSGWRPGEVLVDFRQIRIPDDARPGLYQVVAGMYLPATGDRVGIRTGARTSDALLLGEFEVR